MLWRWVLARQEATFRGPHRDLRSTPYAKAVQNGSHVIGDCAGHQDQSSGDLFIRQSLGNQGSYFLLARCQ
jgi:hypothetical protein